MKKFFVRKAKDTNPVSVCYEVSEVKGLMALTLTVQEYRFLQMLLSNGGSDSTDFPLDWVDQNDGISYSLFDCFEDGGLVIATYRKVS